MSEEANPAVEILKRIQRLWDELGRTKLKTPEYEALLEKIRTLSAEYTKLRPDVPKSC
jgi:hypothetical protein